MAPLRELEQETGRTISVVMQLRLHPNVIALKKRVDSGPKDKVYDIQLTYHTPRGNWYHHSWKGDKQKSGGLLMNIGVHFFDMLLWIFGPCNSYDLKNMNQSSASGILRLEKAEVLWHLSIEKNAMRKRCLIIDGKEIDFTLGFENLHTKWYRHLLNDCVPGSDLNEINQSIKLINNLSS